MQIAILRSHDRNEFLSYEILLDEAEALFLGGQNE